MTGLLFRVVPFMLLSLLTLCALTHSDGRDQAISPAAEPPLPAISRLEIEPAGTRLTLASPEEFRRVIVTGITADGQRFDLTRQAKYQSQDQRLSMTHGVIQANAPLTTTVAIEAAGQKASVSVTVGQGKSEDPVSFVRDVMPILTKTGCNAGTCHGAAKGKNGFKLSLRGYDPDYDWHTLIEDLAGRRFNRADPSASLMLLKPTNAVPHQGGFLFEPGSPYYRTIERWIAQGVQNDAEKTTRVARLSVTPRNIELDLPGRAQQVVVHAHYDDGTSRDVTKDVSYSFSNTETASTSQDGLVTAMRRGEGALLLRYEGQYATVPLFVMGKRDGFQWQNVAGHNFIDTHVYKKLQRIKVQAADLCTDDEFVRRLHLDLTGQIPTPEKVRSFLSDARPSQEKRNALIDELIGSSAFVDHWTHKWCDLLQVNRKFLGEKGMWAFHAWIRDAVAHNLPYDQFVLQLLTATGNPNEEASAAANFVRINTDPKQAAENTTQLFLGTRFSCCQCHDHPFEKWTQKQYHSLSAYFAQVKVQASRRGKEEQAQVFDRRDGGDVPHPKKGTPLPPGIPYDHAGRKAEGATRREALAHWLTDASNPLFAKSVTNRIWSYFFHRGIIDPVDDVRDSNPATNPELLDALTADFLKNGMNLQHLMRTICQSRTYQHSFRTSKWNEDDSLNFAVAKPRRLSAEQLMDSLLIATGSRAAFPNLPGDFRTAQLPDSNIGLGNFLEQFGRPARESSCECERSSDVSLSQAMTMINGPTMANALGDPQGRVAKLLAKKSTPDAMIEELYLAAWSRLPTAAEKEKALKLIGNDSKQTEAAQDLLWALLNSPAFLFNR